MNCDKATPHCAGFVYAARRITCLPDDNRYLVGHRETGPPRRMPRTSISTISVENQRIASAESGAQRIANTFLVRLCAIAHQKTVCILIAATALELHVYEATVRTLRQRAYRKLSVNSGRELMALLIRTPGAR